MIADRTSGVKSTSTMGGESFQAGIDDENMAHIISLFTDLYSDTELAVIREYSTNARDAQIEAGIFDVPIEVTLPSSLSSFFTVKDCGVGLDKADIAKVYSRYGTSTKRATNDQNGMLGLGCKSALTYAQQFTVTSVKDGRKTVCSITRVDNGVPSFQVVSETDTDEANGTLVMVPARKGNNFDAKARNLFRFWPKGSVLVNGSEPAQVTGLDLGRQQVTVEWGQNSMQVDMHLKIADRDAYFNTDMVVMGGVAYPAPNLSTGLPYYRKLLVDVSIGAVDFTPSRESLMHTPKTEATLASLGDSLSKAASEAVQREIDNAKTPRDAIKVIVAWKDLLPDGIKNLKFGKIDVPETLEGEWITSTANGYKLSGHSRTKGIPVDNTHDALFITGYVPASFTATTKKKLNQYCDEQNIQHPRLYILSAEATINTDWIDKDQIVEWEDVRKVKLPRAAMTKSGRPTGSYDGWVGARWQHIMAADIDEDGDVFYYEGGRYPSDDYHTVLLKSYPDLTFLALPPTRVAKFKRNFPDALEARDEVIKLYKAWESKISDDMRLALAIEEEGMIDVFASLDPKRIDDPEIRKSIKIASETDLSKFLETRTRFRYALGTVPTSTPWENPLDPYTMLSYEHSYGSWQNISHPHVYIYLNAVYAANNA